MLLISCFPVKMGMADAIVDLVSSGTTLRENNLKEIEGGVVVESQVNLLTNMNMHGCLSPLRAEAHGPTTLKLATFPTPCYFTQATLVASRKSLHKRKGVLEITHELLERLEAHLRATAELMVSLNMACASMIILG
jgi:ATP phosphoribosyltransferase